MEDELETGLYSVLYRDSYNWGRYLFGVSFRAIRTIVYLGLCWARLFRETTK